MGNEVAVRNQSNAVATAADQWADLANQYSAGGGDGGGVQFLKFNGNDGEFTYGANREVLDIGTQLAVNMESYEVGFICWKEGEVVDEKMVPIVSGQSVSKADLPDHGPYKTYEDGTKDGWSEQRSVNFKGIEDGTDYQFKTTSKSGLIALGNLLRDFAKGVKLNDGKVPVIELAINTFTPKNNPRAGKKHAPTFKIVAWVDQNELAETISSNSAAAAEEEVAAPPPPPPAPAPAAEGGRRGRRF